MSITIMTTVWKKAPFGEAKLLVLLALADWCNDQGVCWPSMEALGKKARIERRSARRIVHQLELAGYLEIETGTTGAKQNKYHLNLGKLENSEGRTQSPPSVAQEDTESHRVPPRSAGEDTESKKGRTPESPDPSLEPSVDPPREPPYKSAEFLEALNDWEQHKKEIRDPLKPTGRKMLYKKLAGLGEQQAIAAIEHSIANGWKGIYEERERTGSSNGGRPAPQTKADASLEAARQVAAKLRGEA